MENREDSDPDDIAPGTVIAEKFCVVRQLGAGGMGVVFQVSHKGTGRSMAVKVMRRTRDSQFKDRFMAEARAACAVEHPAIVAVHDVLESDGRVMMVMDYLDGHNLLDALSQRQGGKLHIMEVAAYLLPIVSALGFLHTKSLVHRDVKPENIFISNGKSFLLDLGVVKDLQSSARLTQTNGAIGTPLYMSPEQAFDKYGPVDHRTDIWAMGMLLYECLTGTVPTEATSAGEVYALISQGNFKPVKELDASIPDDVSELIASMLSADREQRPSISQVYDVLAKHGNTVLLANYPRPAGPPAISTLAGRLAAKTNADPFGRSSGPGISPGISPRAASVPAASASAAPAAAAAPVSAPRSKDPHRQTGGPTTTSPSAKAPKTSYGGALAMLFGLVIVGALGGGGFFVWRGLQADKPASPVRAAQTVVATTETAASSVTVAPTAATATATSSETAAIDSSATASSAPTVGTGWKPGTSRPTTAATTAVLTVSAPPTAATTAPPTKSTGIEMPFPTKDPTKP